MSDKTDDLFSQAREMANPAERRVFLEKACAGAPELLVIVKGLLAARKTSHRVVGSNESR